MSFDAAVCIVGLGPVGASLAHNLAALEHSIICFEKEAETPYWAPRAVVLNSEVVRCSRLVSRSFHEWLANHIKPLGELTIRDGIAVISRPRHHLFSWNLVSFGTQTLERRKSELMTGQECYFLNSFDQPSFERELRRGLECRSNVKVFYDAEVVSVVTENDEHNPRCKVQLRNGQVFTCKYCIAADGGSSSLRKLFHADWKGTSYPDQPWLVVDTEIYDENYLNVSSFGFRPFPIFTVGSHRTFVSIKTPAFFESWWEEATKFADENVEGWNSALENVFAFRSHAEEEKDFNKWLKMNNNCAACELDESLMMRGRWQKTREQFISHKIEEYQSLKGKFPARTGLRFEILLSPAEADPSMRNHFLADDNISKFLKTVCGINIEGLQIVRKVIYVFHARRASKWRFGNVLLVGDAAHCMPPFTGQGLNSGMRDIYNLAWKLSYVLNGVAQPDLLDSYVAERNANVDAITKQTQELGKFLMRSNTLQTLWQDMILGIKNIFAEPWNWVRRNTCITDIRATSEDGPLCLSRYFRDRNLVGILFPSITVRFKSLKLSLDSLFCIRGFTAVIISESSDVINETLSNLKFEPLQSLRVKIVCLFCNSEDKEKEEMLCPFDSSLDRISVQVEKEQVHFYQWIKNYDVQNSLILVRPDLYIYGVYSMTEALASVMIEDLVHSFSSKK